MADFASQGIRFIEPEPVKGAGDFLCNFLVPSATRGVITEYVELLPGAAPSGAPRPA